MPNAPAPPYNPAPKPPLNSTQRARILAYLHLVFPVGNIDFGAMNDTQLLQQYGIALGAAGATGTGGVYGDPSLLDRISQPGVDIAQGAAGVAGSITSVVDFLRELASFLFDPVRMGELVGGLILLGVGVSALAKGSLASGANKAVRPVVNVTTAPLRAARAADAFKAETTRHASRAYETSHARAAGRKAGSNG